MFEDRRECSLRGLASIDQPLPRRADGIVLDCPLGVRHSPKILPEEGFECGAVAETPALLLKAVSNPLEVNQRALEKILERVGETGSYTFNKLGVYLLSLLERHTGSCSVPVLTHALELLGRSAVQHPVLVQRLVRVYVDLASRNEEPVRFAALQAATAVEGHADVLFPLALRFFHVDFSADEHLIAAVLLRFQPVFGDQRRVLYDFAVDKLTDPTCSKWVKRQILDATLQLPATQRLLEIAAMMAIDPDERDESPPPEFVSIEGENPQSFSLRDHAAVYLFSIDELGYDIDSVADIMLKTVAASTSEGAIKAALTVLAISCERNPEPLRRHRGLFERVARTGAPEVSVIASHVLCAMSNQSQPSS
jgi:hypothetical protein